MLSLGALVLVAALAPRADAQSPAGEPKAIPDIPVDASATRDPYLDAGLRPVSFETTPVHASTHRVVSPDLRDPFRMAKRGAAEKGKPLQLHGDLRDPFARHRKDPKPQAPADLRNPFDGERPACRARTEDGVEIQRPKSMRCAAARAEGRSRLARR